MHSCKKKTELVKGRYKRRFYVKPKNGKNNFKVFFRVGKVVEFHYNVSDSKN